MLLLVWSLSRFLSYGLTHYLDGRISSSTVRIAAVNSNDTIEHFATSVAYLMSINIMCNDNHPDVVELLDDHVLNQVNYLNIKLKIKTKKDVEGVKTCSNPGCAHSSNDHFSPLHPKSAGDLFDTSCTLCSCEKLRIEEELF